MDRLNANDSQFTTGLPAKNSHFLAVIHQPKRRVLQIPPVNLPALDLGIRVPFGGWLLPVKLSAGYLASLHFQGASEHPTGQLQEFAFKGRGVHASPLR